MMKKIISFALAMVMVLSMVACGNSNNNEETTTEENGPASALEVLETIWGSYKDDEKFPVMGGDYDNMVDSAPGAFDATNTDNLTAMLLVPADKAANVKEAASLFHGMNFNNFTCGVFGLADGVEAKAFAETMQAAIQGNMWMCGFPDKLVIANVGGYVLVSFGVNDAINPFEAKLTAAYPNAEILYSEAVQG